jgi:hypothetical protein
VREPPVGTACRTNVKEHSICSTPKRNEADVPHDIKALVLCSYYLQHKFQASLHLPRILTSHNYTRHRYESNSSCGYAQHLLGYQLHSTAVRKALWTDRCYLCGIYGHIWYQWRIMCWSVPWKNSRYKSKHGYVSRGYYADTSVRANSICSTRLH